MEWLIQVGQQESGLTPPTSPLRDITLCAANMLLESWRLHYNFKVCKSVHHHAFQIN